MKVFAYYRVSTEMQSIKTQKFAVSRWLNEINVEVVEEFIDEAYTGAIDQRPRYQEMLSRLNEVDGIATYALDRISRDLEDGMTFMFKIEREGKLLYLAMSRDICDFKGNTNQLMTMISFWAAAMEKNKINQRQKDAIRRRIESGGSWGRKVKKINWKYYDELMLKLNGNKSAVARVIGVSPVTLWRRLKERNN